MADIFLSYSRADRDTVANIVAALEAEGWSVWWDTRLRAGEQWDEAIEREINAARCVFVVWSPLSVTRYWVKVEANFGLSRGVLVPVAIDGAEPPLAFTLIQTANLAGWDGDGGAPALRRAVEDIREKLRRTPGPAPAPTQPQPATYTPPPASQPDHYHAAEEWKVIERSFEGRIRVAAAFARPSGLEWFLPGGGKAEGFKDADFAPEMVVVPAGEFWMGSKDGEGGDSQHPRHKVRIPRPLAVGRYALTFDEWDAARAADGVPHNPSDLGWGRGRRPVINVSSEDAQAYLKWLSDKTGQYYRLLSEAEWEYCCRAGTSTHFWWGDEISTGQANYDGNYTFGKGGKGEYRQKTVPVDSFQPNPWGLYQMHGNVWEWCEDCWHDNYHNAPADGPAWTSGDCGRRVLRGGSWFDDPQFCRAANRTGYSADIRINIIGFRAARTLP